MNERNGTVAAMLIGFGLAGAAYVAAPMLAPDEARAQREAAPNIEKARRLLAAYKPDVDRANLLAADLALDQVSVVPKNVAEAAAKDSFRQDYEEARDASVAAGGGKKPSGGVEGQIQEGIKVYTATFTSNKALLKDALSAVDDAMKVTVGHASMSADSVANRLRGTILYQQGCATANEAMLARGRIEPLLAAMTERAAAAREAAAQQSLISDSKIDERLAGVGAEIAKHQEYLMKTTAEFNGLDAKVREAEARLTKARAEAEAARTAFEDLSHKGLDFASPDGFEQFSRAYLDQAKRYREALRQAGVTEFGAYPSATIDDTGDYLKGRLLENGSDAGLTAQVGLDYLRTERERAGAVKKSQETTIAELTQVRSQLTRQKEMWQADADVAKKRLAEARTQGAELLTKLQQAEADADKLDKDAVGKFTQAAQSLKTALTSAEQAISIASQKSRDVSPTAQPFSGYTKLASTTVNVYHLGTEQAEALAGAAWVLQQQQASRAGEAAVVRSAADALALSGDGAKTLADAATESTTQATALVDQAVEILQRTHTQTGQRWTVTAEFGGVGYLYVLLGKPDALASVKQNYRAALDGRDTEAMALPIKERLNFLESKSP